MHLILGNRGSSTYLCQIKKYIYPPAYINQGSKYSHIINVVEWTIRVSYSSSFVVVVDIHRCSDAESSMKREQAGPKKEIFLYLPPSLPLFSCGYCSVVRLQVKL